MKTDFKKTLDCYRARSGEFRIVEAPPLQYLMVDGHGDPNTSGEYATAIQALYPVAYRLKFASKKLGQDYVVPPLEALCGPRTWRCSRPRGTSRSGTGR